jgi:hypothetical protein
MHDAIVEMQGSKSYVLFMNDGKCNNDMSLLFYWSKITPSIRK